MKVRIANRMKNGTRRPKFHFDCNYAVSTWAKIAIYNFWNYTNPTWSKFWQPENHQNGNLWILEITQICQFRRVCLDFDSCIFNTYFLLRKEYRRILHIFLSNIGCHWSIRFYFLQTFFYFDYFFCVSWTIKLHCQAPM